MMCSVVQAERPPGAQAFPGKVVCCRRRPPAVDNLALEDPEMLRLAILFLIIALIAAVLGFGLVVNTSIAIAKILFFVFLVLAVLSYLGGGGLRSRPPL